METIEIEKGIPVPEKQKGRKYPLPEMEVGDSIFIKGYTRSKHQGIYNVCRCFSKNHNPSTKFVIRKWWDGIRIWRIK